MNIWNAATSDELIAIAMTTVTTNARLRSFAGILAEFADNGDGESVRKLLPLALAYAYAEGISAACKPKEEV